MQAESRTVLIIDDSPAEHALYREYLQACGYRFLDAYTGEEGTRLYGEHTVDCVIVDYRLPDIDGLEVLKRLTQMDDIVPAVMLTGEGNETIAVVAMQTGSQDYLPKRVVSPQALTRTIERAAERTRLMRRMEEYRGQLERSNEDLERFVTVVAHDLKSPLRAIAQHLELIRSRCGETLDKKALTSFRFAIDGAARMQRLIDALFELSRAGFETRPFALVNANQVLEGVLANLASHIDERGAKVTSGTLPTLMADGMQLVQLFQNLIGNALKFCTGTPQVHVDAMQEGDMWIFSVHDNGIGIAPEGMDKIFTIFRRLHTEEEYPGCGVGLAICERVVKNHHGRIWVESAPGEGSTFCFALPAAQALAHEKAA